MAAPLQPGKQTVDLAAPPSRGARIRRDPAPATPLRMSIAERDERNQKIVAIGIAAFTLAIAVIVFALGSVTGWSSPSDYVLVM